MKSILLIALLLASNQFAVDEDFEIDESGRPHKNLKDLEKMIYVQDFRVHFQVGTIRFESQQNGRQL